MNIHKVVLPSGISKSYSLADCDHFVSLEWSMKVMAVAHLGQRSKEPTVVERPADLKDLQQYLSSLKGHTVLTFEETSTAQWLFVELYDFVDRIIVCDPLHNRWLCHGPKTDKIDARKLCVLLHGGLLKEVFHSMDALYGLRSLVSSYDDVVRAGVRLLNQRRAMERSKSDTRHHAAFVLEHLDKSIEVYRETKEQYAVKFTRFCRRHVSARHLLEVEGIGTIGAVKILATVIDAHRFRNRGHYLAYCGLVRNEKLSGGRSYGCRHPRYSRSLKAVYKTAAMTVIQHGDSPIRKYYEHLLGQGIAEHNARHAIARYIARITYGMLKTGTRYEPYRWRTTLEAQRVA